MCELVLIAFTIISVRRGLLCLPRSRSIAKKSRISETVTDKLAHLAPPVAGRAEITAELHLSAVRLSAACSSPSSLRSA